MMRIGIVVGSTRPGRNAEAVANWVHREASRRTDAEFELVDLAGFALPLLDEPAPPSSGRHEKAHSRAWARTVAALDGFVFVTPEYNHGIPASLKNAIDYLFHEWANKAGGFVSYGSAGGARAVEHLRGVLAEVGVATVRAQVMFHLATDFENYTTFKEPGAAKVAALATLLDQVVAWSGALRPLRSPSAEPTGASAGPVARPSGRPTVAAPATSA